MLCGVSGLMGSIVCHLPFFDFIYAPTPTSPLTDPAFAPNFLHELMQDIRRDFGFFLSLGRRVLQNIHREGETSPRRDHI